MGFSETIYGILFYPLKTLEQIGQEKPLVSSLLVYITVALLSMLFNQAVETTRYNSLLAGSAGWALNILGIIVSLVNLFVMAGVLSLLGEMVFKRSNAAGLLACLGYSALPGVLGPPLYYAFILLGSEGLGLLALVLVGLWVLVLWVVSIKEAFGLATSQSILLLLLPPIVLSALVFFLLIALVLAIGAS